MSLLKPIWLGVAALFGLGTSGLLQAADPPNIVWIISDDLSPDLGCYGDPVANTPNLDAFAEESLRFTRAYSSAPVCSASRSGMITGMYQTSIGAHNHRTITKQDLPGDIKPVTDLLEDAGYKTINLKNALGANGKTDFNFTHGKVFDSIAGLTAIPFDRPFFAQINIFQPHRGFSNANDGVEVNDVVIPPYYADDAVSRADWEQYLDSVFLLDQKIGDILNWIDDPDGDPLTDDSIAANTVVFFFGDHGRPHMWDKQFLWEGGIKVPLLIRWPGQLTPNTVTDQLTSLIDLAPTALNIAGAEIPDWMEGQAISTDPTKHRDCLFAAKDRSGDAFDRSRCVVTKRYKYIRNYYPEIPIWQTSRYKGQQYPMFDHSRALHDAGSLTPLQDRYFDTRKAPEELYDLENDPGETTNLVGDVGHRESLYELREKLREWVANTGDRGQIPEPDAIQIQALASAQNGYTDPWAAANDAIEADLAARDWMPAASAQRVGLIVNDAVANESDGSTATIKVVRSGDTAAALDIPMFISGTASPGSDYTALPTTASFGAHQTELTLTIDAISDEEPEDAETVTISLDPDYDRYETDLIRVTVQIVDADLSSWTEETMSGLPLADRDPNANPDGDDAVNFIEFLDKRNPLVADPGTRAPETYLAAGPLLGLKFHALPDEDRFSWLIETTSSLTNSGWTPLDPDDLLVSLLPDSEGRTLISATLPEFGTPRGFARIQRAWTPRSPEPFGAAYFDFRYGRDLAITDSATAVVTSWSTPFGGISSSNSNAFMRSTDASDTLANSISFDKYHEFTVIPAGDLPIDYTTLSFDHGGSDATGTSFSSNISLFVSTNGFASAPDPADLVASSTVTVPANNGTTDYVNTAVMDLSLAASLQQQAHPVTFRFYFHDDGTAASNQIHRLDHVQLTAAR